MVVEPWKHEGSLICICLHRIDYLRVEYDECLPGSGR